MSKKESMVIEIPIDDWVEEWKGSVVKPKNQDDIIAAMQETAIKPTQMGRLALVGREMGHAEEDILRPNKITLQLGAAYQVSRIAIDRRVNVEVGNKTYSARQFIASVEEYDDPDADADEPLDAETQVLVDIHDDLAVERVTKYLFTKVTGSIWQRLLILAANKVDLRDVTAKLKDEIDNMVERLT